MRDFLSAVLVAVALAAFALIGVAQPAASQDRDAAADLAGQTALARMASQAAASSWDELQELLSIPNDAHYPDHVDRNVAWMKQAFQRRDFKVSVLESGGPPLLLAERGSPRPDDPTVLIYLQVDGQPVDTSAWFQESPYDPVLKEHSGGDWTTIPWTRLEEGPVDPDWRIFARSASDAKGPVGMFLAALDAAGEHGLKQSHHLKVVMDFEEELGSPHLPGTVELHREALAADFLIIYDGPRHVSNVPSLTFGARGIATITLTVFGPRVAQHSGHWGNYVPNPALRLAQVLGSMKDADGRVTIPGFYDGIHLDEETRAILAKVPDDEPAIRRSIGIAKADGVARTYQESIQYPSLNIRGLAAGWIGDDVRTIIPPSATAEIDVRIVPESDPVRLIALIYTFIEEQGFHLIGNRNPTEEERQQFSRLASFDYSIAYQAYRTPYDSRVGIWLTSAMRRAFGTDPVRKRMSGGSIPISPFITTLGVPAVTVPTVNADNNQHSPNENLRVGNYIDGIRTFLAILTEPIQ
ncbi:MAG: acetylornithine deacetylase/succinyl-diaminopimelate desuccinylase-like protein [Rhodothermales bacterium]|jgi:acetylornithine deacetylase/succinyl-diaminopimelate desuccinylase-like protein